MNPYYVAGGAVIVATVVVLLVRRNLNKRPVAPSAQQHTLTAEVFLARFLGVGIRLRPQFRTGAVRENFALIESPLSPSTGGPDASTTPDLRLLSAEMFVIHYLGATAFGSGDDASGGGWYAWAKYGNETADLACRELGCVQRNLQALRDTYAASTATTS